MIRGIKSILNVELLNLSVIRGRKSLSVRDDDRRWISNIKLLGKMQIYNNFLILDFESTCEKYMKIKPQVCFLETGRFT